MGKILIIEKTQEISASEEIQIKNIGYLGVAEKVFPGGRLRRWDQGSTERSTELTAEASCMSAYPDMLPILNGFSIIA